jgi:large subunit ribosomal protein L7A
VLKWLCYAHFYSVTWLLSAWRMILVSIMEELSDASKRIVGSKQVIKHAGSLKNGKVYIARDADEPLIEKLKQECEKHNIEYDVSHTMQQIGSASGIEVGSACAAVKR